MKIKGRPQTQRKDISWILNSPAFWMSLSISGELCRCSASRFWGLTGEPKSDTCIFKIKQFFAAGTTCVFVFVFTLQTVTSLVFLLSLSNVGRKLVAPIFPAFFVGNTAINRPTLTRPGMDRKMEFLAPYTHLNPPSFRGSQWGWLTFNYSIYFYYLPKQANLRLRAKVSGSPVKSCMGTRENASSLSFDEY